MQTVHGTAVAMGEAGALVRGASGSGKSDLALRFLGLAVGPLCPEPPRLVSDDRVIVTRDRDALRLSAPDPLCGLIEIRGFGIVSVDWVDNVRLALIVDLVAIDQIERLPEPASALLCGIAVPLVRLAPFEASAPFKLAAALRQAALK